MTRVKVIGAGSIGNHLSHAARRKGWSVAICDIDPAALERTRTQIYPSRYGAWDESIALYSSDEAPRGGFDYIFVGTPPDSHMALALAALDEKPRAILIEKPLAGADLAGCQELYEKSRGSGTRLFVGYDHVVAKSLTYLASEAANGFGPVETIDVSFREHWQGIFNAHPWLSGPADTYLGYWQRGGGALGEHSHAVNMWQHLAHAVGAGRVTKVTSALDYIEQGKAEYDRIAHLTLETEMGLCRACHSGRCDSSATQVGAGAGCGQSDRMAVPSATLLRYSARSHGNECRRNRVPENPRRRLYTGA
jgi:predicted dehydrogenase